MLSCAWTRWLTFLLLWGTMAGRAGSPANRLAYLDQDDPFQVGLGFPRLTTPQWFGEAGVDAVVTLGIDDLRGNVEKYEAFLRPILERLKQVEGRAAASIFCNAVAPDDPQVRRWIEAGVNLEVHTLSHPCPILARSNLVAAVDTFLGGVDLMHRIPGNHPVAFRTPCCDSINSPSPRLFAEIFGRTTGEGRYLQADSSIMNVFTGADAGLPRELVLDGTGKDRFRRYLPFPSFVTTVENYPYPFVVGGHIWEFPAVVPSDWEAQHVQGVSNTVTTGDWKAALDLVVAKQGTFNLIYHPHGWSSPQQVVELIDHAVTRYGRRVRFLNFHEAVGRLTTNLLGGEPLRATDGGDNGVRLVDVNDDGYMDVLIGNDRVQETRVWDAQAAVWKIHKFPATLNVRPPDGGPARANPAVRFGIFDKGEGPVVWLANEATRSAWAFMPGRGWESRPELLRGLDVYGRPVAAAEAARDRGIRFRDVDGDGSCEMLLSNAKENAAYRWDRREVRWVRAGFELPAGTSIVDGAGRDNGLRFVDVDGDGIDDVLFSNQERCSLHLWTAGVTNGRTNGWGRKVFDGIRGEAPFVIPPIVRSGTNRNNGFWTHSGHAWWQNEDTAHLPDHVDRRSFGQLRAGYQPVAKPPEAASADMVVRPGFVVETVAGAPLVKEPVSLDWDARGRLWVLETGSVRVLEDTNGDGRYDKSTLFLDGLKHPTGLLPWRAGVLLLDAPNLLYAEDKTGDGRADERRVLFTGFREEPSSGLANGLEYGFDGWIYGAGGGNGGRIRSTRAGAEVNVDGHDFRLRPDSGAFEAVEGVTQIGRRRDDWGNWFGGTNSTWAWHYLWPSRYISRNPLVQLESNRQVLTSGIESHRVHALAQAMPGRASSDADDLCRAATGPTPYRDDLFGPEFAHAIFVAEPAHGLIRCLVLATNGISFDGARLPDEGGREFLASRDPRFRPVLLKMGPDGALYVVDRYQRDDGSGAVRAEAPADAGRIFRVYPRAAKLGAPPDYTRLSDRELAARMDSPNGWCRDMVQRLILERRILRAGAPLEEMVRHSTDARVRLQALATIDLLRILDDDLLVTAFRDEHPRVREYAVELTERALPASARRVKDWIRDLSQVAMDPSLRVRRQMAFSLGEWRVPDSGRLLAVMASELPMLSDLKLAILTSLVPHAQTFSAAIAADGTNTTARSQFGGVSAAIKAMGLDSGAANSASFAGEIVDGATRPTFKEMNARAAVVREWIGKVQGLAGDAGRGARIHDQACSVCHALRGAGAERAAGPDLGALKDYSVAAMVTSILDPNRAVEDRYKTRVVDLVDGTNVSGIVAEQGPNGLVLQLPDGTRRVVLRVEIKSVKRLETSPMPEAFENSLTPQGVADLIAHLVRK